MGLRVITTHLRLDRAGNPHGCARRVEREMYWRDVDARMRSFAHAQWASILESHSDFGTPGIVCRARRRRAAWEYRRRASGGSALPDFAENGRDHPNTVANRMAWDSYHRWNYYYSDEREPSVFKGLSPAQLFSHIHLYALLVLLSITVQSVLAPQGMPEMASSESLPEDDTGPPGQLIASSPHLTNAPPASPAAPHSVGELVTAA
ncbi:MAG: hypothetical protein WBW80_23155 [Acidimicrobiales bacterium]